MYGYLDDSSLSPRQESVTASTNAGRHCDSVDLINRPHSPAAKPVESLIVRGLSYYTFIGIDSGISHDLGPVTLSQVAFRFQDKITAGRGPAKADLTRVGLDIQRVRL